jgi:tetratricopeptide (TPR) repeat protein
MEAVRLIDAADGTIAWAKSYDHKGDPNPNRSRGRIANDVAQTLLQQFGVIQAREASKRANADPMQDSYRCMLDTNAYQRSFNPSLYGPARDCLEHATAESHPLDGVFVKLARLYVSDYQFGGAGGPAGNRAALVRAYQMAERAVDIKPTSAVAQFAMEQVLLARRDFEQAKVAGENALSLNPYDNAVIFGHAARLILTGQIDEGLTALRQNTNKKTAVWTGHHFLLALGSYLKDDLATAEMEDSQIANENFPPGLMLDALVAARNKNRLRARHDIEVLYAKYPSWRDDARANIGYFLPDRDMAERISNEFDTVVYDLKKHPDVVGSVKPAGHP